MESIKRDVNEAQTNFIKKKQQQQVRLASSFKPHLAHLFTSYCLFFSFNISLLLLLYTQTASYK